MCINKGFENELLEFSIESEENRILAKRVRFPYGMKIRIH